MSDLVVTVVENSPTVTVSDATVAVDIVESVTQLTVSNVGMQGIQGVQGATGATGATGPQGASGVVAVTSPITNSGTSTSAQLGLDQSAITLAQSQVTSLTTDLAGKAALTATQTITGTTTVLSANAANQALIIKGAASQSGDYFTIQNNGGTTIGAFTSGGSFYNNGQIRAGASTSFAQLSSIAGSAATIGLGVRGAASQTASLQEWQLSDGSVLSQVDSVGHLWVRSTAATFGAVGNFGVKASASTRVPVQIAAATSQSVDLTRWYAADGTTILARVNQSGAGVFSSVGVFGAQSAIADTSLSTYATYASQKGIVVKGAASQTANLQEWQESNAGVPSAVNATGQLRVRTFGGSMGFTALGVAAATTTEIGAVIRGAASQTANLTEWQDSAATVLAKVESNGWIHVPALRVKNGLGAPTVSAQAYFEPQSASTIGAIIRGAASQSTNLLEIQRSDGGSVFTVRNNGNFGGGSLLTGTNAWVNNDVLGASVIGMIIRGAASQSANLQEWQDSTGTIQTLVNSSGGFTTNQRGTFGTTSLSGLAHLTVAQGNTGRVSFGVQNTQSSNTGDLVSYFNSSSAVIGGRNSNAQIYTGTTAGLNTNTGGATTAASGTGTTATITTTSNHNLAVGDVAIIAGVTPTGYNGTYVLTGVTATTISYANATTGSQTVAGTVAAPAQVSITSRSAGTMPLYVNGPTGQSAVLTKWAINQSTVAQVTSVGNVQSVGFQSLPNAYLNMTEENAGGRITMTRATSAAANPGANLAKIYFRDGTIPGTLKLVVRAGAAGAETTIYDNIPQ